MKNKKNTVSLALTTMDVLVAIWIRLSVFQASPMKATVSPMMITMFAIMD
jgi:hypothetical protein